MQRVTKRRFPKEHARDNNAATTRPIPRPARIRDFSISSPFIKPEMKISPAGLRQKLNERHLKLHPNVRLGFSADVCQSDRDANVGVLRGSRIEILYNRAITRRLLVRSAIAAASRQTRALQRNAGGAIGELALGPTPVSLHPGDHFRDCAVPRWMDHMIRPRAADALNLENFGINYGALYRIGVAYPS